MNENDEYVFDILIKADDTNVDYNNNDDDLDIELNGGSDVQNKCEDDYYYKYLKYKIKYLETKLKLLSINKILNNTVDY